MVEKKVLSIIIVNYNGEKYLKECIDSIYEKNASLSFEIIIFDNNSQDGSITSVKRNFPEVVIYENDQNIGFAAANNRAVNMASGTYILLLNYDTVLQDRLDELIKVIEEDDNIGALGIKMLNGHEEYIPSFGKFPSPFNLFRISNLNYTSNVFLSGDFEGERKISVNWISGAFLLTKKEYYQRVDGLDESFFMYVEDVDFCKKLNDINLKTVYYPKQSFVHYVGFSPNRESLLIKGYAIYASKHFNKFEEKFANTLLYFNYAFKKIFKNIR